MKNIITLTIFMICTLLQTQLSAKPVRPAKKWKDVHKLLLDEKKTIRRLGARGIIYKHRIFEIDNELMKIVRDKEHKRFFELAKKNKIKGRKEDYYKNSMKQIEKKGRWKHRISSWN